MSDHQAIRVKDVIERKSPSKEDVDKAKESIRGAGNIVLHPIRVHPVGDRFCPLDDTSVTVAQAARELDHEIIPAEVTA